jgi:hypothetical protein
VACRAALIVYHANLEEHYERRWIDAFVASIRAQSYQVPILELDYSDEAVTEEQLFSEALCLFRYPLANHAEAQNFLLDVAFGAFKFDLVLNTNVDDTYSPTRVAEQVHAFEETGAYVISSDFDWVNEASEFMSRFRASGYDVEEELGKCHNVICHPVVAYSRDLIEDGFRYDPAEIPAEDLHLWQRVAAVDWGRFNPFVVVPEVLCEHRWHPGSVSERT